MIRTNIVVILAMFNFGCQFPSIPPQPRLAWSVQFQTCFEQIYDLNTFSPVTEMQEVGIERCDDLVGFAAETWAKKITPWAHEVKAWVKDRCPGVKEKAQLRPH